MGLNILNTTVAPIPSHAYAAFLAVFVGSLQLTKPKGTAVYNYLGYTLVILMLWVSLSTFWIETLKVIGPFIPIHFLSNNSIWSVVDAIKSAKNW